MSRPPPDRRRWRRGPALVSVAVRGVAGEPGVGVIDWAGVFLDPTGQVERGADRVLAERSGTLDGATLALLDNGKPNANLLLEEVGRQLSERFRLDAVKVFTKGYFGTPVEQTQVERIVTSCN